MEVDVIVIGGGLAGLTAADSLKNHDSSLSVIVLEANEQVGGRIHSEKINDSVFDVGAQWILPEHKSLLQIVDKLGLVTTFPSTPQKTVTNNKNLKKVIQVGRKGRIREITSNPDPVVLPRRLGRHTGIRAWLASLELSYVVWKLDGLMQKIISLSDPYKSLKPELAKYLDSTTVETYLYEKTRFKSVRDVLEIHIRLLMGTDLDRISLLYLLSYAKWQGAVTFHEFLHGNTNEVDKLPPLSVKNGCQNICVQLIKQCIGEENVLLNQPVSHVSILQENDTSDRNVYVSTKDGQTYKSSQVIMAIPPNMLREIEFTPALTLDKRYLVNSMSMGTTIKFIVTYKEKFWLKDGYSGEFVSHSGPITWMADGSDQNGLPTLIGLLGGHLAVNWGKLPEADLEAAILDQISVIFGSWALEPNGFLVKIWQNEPFEQGGTVCFPGIGTMREFASLRKSHGPIHFAGTETSMKYMGTMAGAVHSGQRAAIEVLNILRPQSLTSKDYHLLTEINQKYEEEQPKPVSDWPVYRWTVILPACALITAWAAFKLRATYSYLLVPRM